jgi:hypothetical protein
MANRRAPWIAAALIAGAGCAWLGLENARLRGRVSEKSATANGNLAAVSNCTPEPTTSQGRAKAAQAAVETVLPATEPDPPPGPLAFFGPEAAEELAAYRERILPVAKAVLDPQRARIAKWRLAFEAEAELDEAQRKELDAAVEEASEALLSRISHAVQTGEISPRMKPADGVAIARDLLQIADDTTQRFKSTLRDDQLEALKHSRFDVTDYLFFSTKWEDLLGVEDP